MNKFILPIIALFYLGNNTIETNTKSISIIESSKTNEMIYKKDDLYDLKIKIETKNNKHSLVFSMELKNDSYFMSPNAKGNFTGKFYYDLGTYDKIGFNKGVIETPISIKEIDVYSNESVNWVRKNTTYEQGLNLKSKEDFEIYGRVKFTIEPRCTLEIIPFMISYKSGKLTIKEAKC